MLPMFLCSEDGSSSADESQDDKPDDKSQDDDPDDKSQDEDPDDDGLLDVYGRLTFRNPDPLWVKSKRLNGTGYTNISWEQSSQKFRMKIAGKQMRRYYTAREALNNHPLFLQRKAAQEKNVTQQHDSGEA